MDVFAANDLAAFIIASGAITEVTTAGRFDATYTSKAINGTANASAEARSAQFINPDTGAAVALTDGWAHLEYYNTGNTGQVLHFYDSALQARARLNCTGTGTTYQWQYWNGAAWTNCGGGTFTLNNATLHTLDFHYTCGVGGTILTYQNGNLINTATGLTANQDDFAFISLTPPWSGFYYSQVLVSDSNTVGAKVGSLTPNANGTNTAWANDYTNIVKNGNNDVTFISSSVAGDKETYGATDATLPVNYVVSSVFFAIRGRAGTASPTNVKPLLRIGGVDYAGNNFFGLNAISFAPATAGYTLDPSTAAAWAGIANVNAAEVGYQAAA